MRAGLAAVLAGACQPAPQTADERACMFALMRDGTVNLATSDDLETLRVNVTTDSSPSTPRASMQRDRAHLDRELCHVRTVHADL